ncbi:MAG: hypothetical protein JWR35_911 [Marmoricola sp.]|jgi:hypothetical protein|nr:hypothetical protein [Marmoricola sp.]
MNRRMMVGATVLVAALGAVLVPAASQAQPASTSGVAWSQTHDLTRDYTVGGVAKTDERHVTVTASKRTDLQARERINVSWSGAHPSGARAANPYGENGMNQEYPVVIMECRGLDDASLPADQQLSPNTCWTSTWGQRTTKGPTSTAAWLHDKYATDADTQQVSGVSTLPAECGTLPATFSEHITPFDAVGAKTFSGCNADTMPPEAAIGSTDPPNELEAFTGTDGKGSAQFEVRSDTENASLGCSHTVACSLVVVPIMGLSCKDTNVFCNQTGAFAPGSSNFELNGVNAAVSPQYWWSASNWRGRFSIPLTFGLPPSTCQLLGTGVPTPFYGSELLSQAALQWSPAYCLRKDRFNWQDNTMPDDAAFALMQSGQSAAAEVSGRRSADGPDPVGYAPTAVTGFGIAYEIDKPDNAGEVTTLRLNARLLAKLLTESYPASTMGLAHPGLSKNPISLNLDPEFRKLNPGLDTSHFSEAASTLLTLSTASDVIKTITDYIAHDPEAMAFIDGKADPWGMRINPSYKGIKLPVSTWPLLDTWIPSTPGQICLKNNPAPYLPKVAAPVSSLRLIATATLLSWPNVQTVCDTDPTTGLYKLGRIAPQGVGSRFMLGVVTLADAQRYGLRVASLQAAPGKYVAPDNAGLSGALAVAKHGDPFDPYTISQASIRKSSKAYPGTMVVYTAAKTHGLNAADAKKVAQFISVSSTEGQQAGRGNGQLPAGYLPIKDSGVTKPLFATAAKVGNAIRTQSGKPAATTPPKTPTVPANDSALPTGVDAAPTTSTPATGAPVKTPVVVATATQPVARTMPITSDLGGVLLPMLLFVGLAGGVVAGFGRIALRARGRR